MVPAPWPETAPHERRRDRSSWGSSVIADVIWRQTLSQVRVHFVLPDANAGIGPGDVLPATMPAPTASRSSTGKSRGSAATRICACRNDVGANCLGSKLLQVVGNRMARFIERKVCAAGQLDGRH